MYIPQDFSTQRRPWSITGEKKPWTVSIKIIMCCVRGTGTYWQLRIMHVVVVLVVVLTVNFYGSCAWEVL